MTSSTILVLGGTGKTGRRLATTLRAAGESVRTAARSGADIAFDWHDPAGHAAALAGVDRLYLVPPARRQDYAPTVAAFLDRAEAGGVRHVTLLSANGVQHAPPHVAARATELDLMARSGLSSSLVRPAWFMQNFSEGFLAPGIVGRNTVSAPTGNGAEAFVDADDIADVAAATLRDPSAHEGAAYVPTGPSALTMSEAADILSDALGSPVSATEPDPQEWLDQAVADGLPQSYAERVVMLFDVIRRGQGSAPTEDVRLVAGHEPRSFAEFAHATVDAWRPSALSRP